METDKEFVNTECDNDDKLVEELEKQFPGSPFRICLPEIKTINDLYKLDEPFTTEQIIYLYDDRINTIEPFNRECVKCSSEELNQFNNCIPIILDNGTNAITLRQIINDMIQNAYYNDAELINYHKDYALIGFYKDKYKNNRYYSQFKN